MNKKKLTKKTLFYTLISVIVIAVAVINVSLSYLFEQKMLWTDMTREGLYSISEQMQAEMENVTADVKITFCSDPDILLENYESRYVYVMAMKLKNKFGNIDVECINVEKNPGEADIYRTTSATVINPTDVIISSGGRYRIIKMSSFWTKNESGDYYAFNGEYRAACAILSVASTDNPLVCFTTTHGEKYYNPDDEENSDSDYEELYNLLLLAGMKVGYIDLDTQNIPDDCIMLIMNGATRDYRAEDDDIYKVDVTSPVEKIDRFLTENKSLLVTKDPEVSLPSVEELIARYGIEFGKNTVRNNVTSESVGEKEKLSAVYADSKKDPIGYSIFSDIASLASAPKTAVDRSSQLNLIWNTTNTSADEKHETSGVSIATSAILRSAKETRAYNYDGTIAAINENGQAVSDLSDCGNYVLAAMSVRTRLIGINYFYSYVFAAGTSRILRNDYLGNNAYANGDIIFSAVRTMTRTDRYADDELGAANLNNFDTYGGKKLLSSEIQQTESEKYEAGKLVHKYSGLTKKGMIGYAVFFTLIILIIPAVGIYVNIRRKNR